MAGPTPTHATNAHTPHQSLDRAPRHVSHAQLVSAEEGVHFSHPEHSSSPSAPASSHASAPHRARCAPTRHESGQRNRHWEQPAPLPGIKQCRSAGLPTDAGWPRRNRRLASEATWLRPEKSRRRLHNFVGPPYLTALSFQRPDMGLLITDLATLIAPALLHGAHPRTQRLTIDPQLAAHALNSTLRRPGSARASNAIRVARSRNCIEY